jgi:hypothetical protein
MKATFEDFIKQYPNYKQYQNSKLAHLVYNDILSRDDNMIAMADISDARKPALAACIQEVESFCEQHEDGIFSLTNNFAKQALGTMVKVILEPLGYLTTIQKNMPRGLAKYVGSAMAYEKKRELSLRVVKRLEPCLTDDALANTLLG